MSAGHPAQVRHRAVALVASGKSPAEAVRALWDELGVIVHPSTVRRWSRPGWAERRRRAQRTAARCRYAVGHDGRIGRRQHTPELKVARIAAMAELGVPAKWIAELIAFDFPDDVRLDASDVRYCIETGRYAG